MHHIDALWCISLTFIQCESSELGLGFWTAGKHNSAREGTLALCSCQGGQALLHFVTSSAPRLWLLLLRSEFLYIFTNTFVCVFESPPLVEMICYDKAQPNQAFCQQQLEGVHVFIACTFYTSHCCCSIVNVFIACTGSLPPIQVAL